MAVEVALALDRTGTHSIRVTKIPSTTRDTERGLDLRKIVLISVTFHENKYLDQPPLMGRGY
jgi:hypothetical protein